MKLIQAGQKWLEFKQSPYAQKALDHLAKELSDGVDSGALRRYSDQYFTDAFSGLAKINNIPVPQVLINLFKRNFAKRNPTLVSQSTLVAACEKALESAVGIKPNPSLTTTRQWGTIIDRPAYQTNSTLAIQVFTDALLQAFGHQKQALKSAPRPVASRQAPRGGRKLGNGPAFSHEFGYDCPFPY
jgi:hypothetical protein